MPSVAIVGRPNVGKSTLFNRLTGRRTALVSDMPGLTRDRKEGVADIGGHEVTLIDTAGLEEGHPGSIPARMRAQSEAAIAAADAIVFVIDARAGLLPDDKTFGRIAHATGKPVILVANKCEGRAGGAGLYEAFELGLGEPLAVSAEHGEGIGDLESELLAALGLEPKIVKKQRRRGRGEDAEAEAEVEAVAPPEAEEPTAADKRPIQVAIVGRPNAGKSTLVNAILGEERMITGPEPGLTRDSVATDFDWQGRGMRLFDTAGLRRKARIDDAAEKLAASDAVRAIRFAEVVVLVVDAGHPFEQQDLTIGSMVVEEGRALVIAVNKWDAVEDKQKHLRDIHETVREKFDDAQGVTVLPISALSGRGIDKLMRAVIEAHRVWNRRISTAELNRWLQDALSRHAPPASKGRRIKLRYVTQPSTRPPTFVAFCSQPADLPRSYTKYLVNSLRETFELPGTPIRFSLRKGANPFADR